LWVVDRVSIGEIVRAYADYVALAQALGFEVRKGVVRQHALRHLQYRGDMKSFFSPSYASQYPRRRAPGKVLQAVAELRDDLAKTIRHRLNGQLPRGEPHVTPAIVKALKTLDSARLSVIASEVSAGKHAHFLKSREVPIADFHAALKAYGGDQSIARGKLVEHVRGELEKRGISISPVSIEERLRRNTKVRSVPLAMLEIVRNLGPSFKSGLVPIETLTDGQDPTAWLESCREALGFRSKNAVHKALAQATGVNYETVHKALTNPCIGQRIRIELRDCLLQWLDKTKRGEALPVPRMPALQNGPAHVIRPLLKELAAFYPCVNAMCREAATTLNLCAASVRKIYEGGSNGQATEEGITALRELLETRKVRPPATSYLRDRTVRRFAMRLSEKAEQVRRAWEEKKDESLRETFKRLRLKMIVALKEGHVRGSDRAADPFAEPEYAEAL
jgi:hypothetical protein